MHFLQKMLYYNLPFRPYRLSVRTHPFQGWKRGPTPRRVTNTKKDWTTPVFFVFVKTEAWFASKRTAESGAGKFSFDGMEIIVAHTTLNAEHIKLIVTTPISP